MVTTIISFRSGMSGELVDEKWFLYGIGFSRQLIRKARSTQLSCSGTDCTALGACAVCSRAVLQTLPRQENYP